MTPEPHHMLLIVASSILVIFALVFFFCAPLHKWILAEYLKKKCTLAPIDFLAPTNQLLLSVGERKDKKDAVPQIIIHDESRFWTRFLFDTDVGLGETYVEGIWTSPDLTAVLRHLYFNVRESAGDESIWTRGFSHCMSAKKLVCFSVQKDRERIQGHYDIGNDFYDLFVKESALKAYTCAFFTSENSTLDDAQKNKVDLIIQKMQVKPGQKIADIGCGWGKIANYISQQTGCHVTGITISLEQIKYIQSTFSSENVSVIDKDWRHLLTPEFADQFDAVYSIGMMEAVRYENLPSFLSTVRHMLRDNGRAVLHTIVSPTNTPKQSIENGTFITKHIFPGGQIPMHDWIVNAANAIPGFHLAHSECFGGQHYARTCREWRRMLLEESQYVLSHYSNDLLLKYDYYFASCDAAFSVGLMALGHFVFVKSIPIVGPLSFDNQYFPVVPRKQENIGPVMDTNASNYAIDMDVSV
jgi:cyclopropane-fatty-acyl-phospholipid synthase